jgi:hypothetical protein
VQSFKLLSQLGLEYPDKYPISFFNFILPRSKVEKRNHDYCQGKAIARSIESSDAAFSSSARSLIARSTNSSSENGMTDGKMKYQTKS